MIERALFSLDLDTSFPVEGSLSQDFFHNISIPSTILPGITNPVESSSGPLFTTNDSFYVYESGDEGKYGHTLASYNTSTNSWKQVFISGGEFERAPEIGQGVSDPISGLSFFFGGSRSHRGMLRLNASNPDDVTWTNQTAKFSGSEEDSIPEIAGGAFVYLPVGKAGALLLFGGNDISI